MSTTTARGTTWTIDTTDIPIGSGKTLRIAVERDQETGNAIVAALAIGTGRGRSWTEVQGQGFRLPGGALPALRSALADPPARGLE